MEGDPHILALILIGAAGRLSRWYRPDGRVPPADLKDMVKRMLLHGLLSNGSNGDGNRDSPPVR
jgi:hypothetical protein